MFNREIGFDHPEYLLLLLLIPVLWILSFRSLSGLGMIRRIVSLTLRTLVLAGFVVALAEIQWVETSERVTVIYLLDMSESIPVAKRQLALKYVAEEVSKHRKSHREDRAGVIIFGRDATIEIPPFDDNIPMLTDVESELSARDATNLEAALKLAQASFPEGTAKRIVIVTDGNENLGNARIVAPILADNEIGIDVVPIALVTRAEVAIEKVSLPPDVRRGQPTEVRVVLNNYGDSKPDSPGKTVEGKVRITQRIGQHEQLLGEMDVSLPPGKKVLRFQHTIDQPAVYRFNAVFTPNDPRDDLMPQNNEATAFTHVRGRGRVLLIEDWENRGEFDFMVERLRAKNIEVEIMPSNQLFTSLAILQGFDSVVLANVPRSSGDDAKTVSNFSDDQIQMLVRNTQQMGCGLVMLGGPNSFGAGGWANTELEKAMPVDFQIKNAKIQAVGALVLMMHASEMAQGNHWQKVVAKEALGVLGPMDYCGLLHWDNFGGDAWLWGKPRGLVRISGQKKTMLARLGRMTPGDMPQFDPAMRMGLAGFRRVNASVKHMIIISDGDPAPPSPATIAQYKKAKIKISTVAVGTHGAAGSTPLQNIATQTGGKYYVASDPRALPKIYQKEARRVARPLVKDLNNVSPIITYPHEMLQGIEGPLPPIKGMVLTTVKDNPLVEVAIVSPEPPDRRNSTILAAWNYGAGRSVALTTDCGKRWANSWTEWENYDKFVSQLVRWSMRPVNEEDKFSIHTDVRDGKVRVVVTALNKDDDFLNFLNIAGAGVGPDLAEPFQMRFRQVAPGRYVSEFDGSTAGSYLFNINPGADHGTIRAGVNVPYSAEFRDRETNEALLEFLAQLTPKGGEKGQVIGERLEADTLGSLLNIDTFRHNLARAISSQDAWHWFIVAAACIFFADIFVRRVTLSYEWIAPIVAFVREKIFRRQEEGVDERLDRLRSRKAAVQAEMDERRAAQRFDPEAEAEGEARDLDQVLQDAGGHGAAPPPRTPTAQPITGDETEQDDYTARLLAAKRKAHPERRKRPDDS